MSNEHFRHLLTPSGVSTIMNSNKEPGKTLPAPIVLQVIHVKVIPSPQGDRFRIVLSDGDVFVQGMMATQLNSLVHNGDLQQHGFLSVTDFMPNVVQNKKIIIVLAAQVLPDRATDRIGTPVGFEDVATSDGPGAGASTPKPLYNSTNNNNSYGAASAAPPIKPNAYGSSAPMNVSPTSNPYGSSSSSRPMPQMGSAPVVRSSTAASPFTPISELNLYQSRWTIQARITHKAPVKTWSNHKGEGSLFSIELVDSSGVDIKATFFKEAVDRFYSMLEEGKVYSMSGGRLKVADAKWNSCKSPHEITFDQNSEIHLCTEAAIEDAPFEFVTNIAALEEVQVQDGTMTLVDVLAYVQTVGDVATIISKKQGKEFQKCEVVLVDDSQAQITMTLWGEHAHKAADSYRVGELMAIRRARLSGYGGGKSLSGPQKVTRALQEPSVARSPAFGRLQEWHARTGGNVTGRSLSGSSGFGGGPTPLAERKCVADIKREHLGYQNSDKGDYISVHATLAFLKRDKEGGAWYPACPNDKEPCRSRCKVTPTAMGGEGDSWSCERCNNTYQTCVRRWIFSGVVEDTSGSTWVTFFDDAGVHLLGASADDVHSASEGNIPSDAYDSTFAKAAYTEWLLKLRCKLEPGQDGGDARVKASVQSIHPVNYVQESKDLLAAIAQF